MRGAAGGRLPGGRAPAGVALHRRPGAGGRRAGRGARPRRAAPVGGDRRRPAGRATRPAKRAARPAQRCARAGARRLRPQARPGTGAAQRARRVSVGDLGRCADSHRRARPAAPGRHRARPPFLQVDALGRQPLLAAGALAGLQAGRGGRARDRLWPGRRRPLAGTAGGRRRRRGGLRRELPGRRPVGAGDGRRRGAARAHPGGAGRDRRLGRSAGQAGGGRLPGRVAVGARRHVRRALSGVAGAGGGDGDAVAPALLPGAGRRPAGGGLRLRGKRRRPGDGDPRQRRGAGRPVGRRRVRLPKRPGAGDRGDGRRAGPGQLPGGLGVAGREDGPRPRRRRPPRHTGGCGRCGPRRRGAGSGALQGRPRLGPGRRVRRSSGLRRLALCPGGRRARGRLPGDRRAPPADPPGR